MSSESINPFDRGKSRKKLGLKRGLLYGVVGLFLFGSCSAIAQDDSVTVSNQEQEISRLKSDLDKANKELNNVENSSTTSSKKLDDLTKENNNLKEDLEKSKSNDLSDSSKIKELEDVKVAQEREISSLKSSIDREKDSNVVLPGDLPKPVPKPEVVPVPEPVQEVVPPKQEVSPVEEETTGGVKTCKEIGHKTRRGDGLYIPDHDRDGNGIGCESYAG